MDERLSLDPKTKQQIKELLYNFLYGGVAKIYKKNLDALIIQNRMIQGGNHDSFIYKGTVFSCQEGALPRKILPLHPKLRPTMDGYLEEAKRINQEEMPYVLGFINQTLNASNALHDYLRILPESIHQPIHNLIHSCACRAKTLTSEEVRSIQAKNEKAIEMMKQRMVTNLLI